MAVPPEVNRHSAMILVVDNVEAIRCAHNQLLSRAGYRVIEASTGEEALLKATSHRPNVMVLDVNLPGIDGFEVCRRLKADRETSPIMVLLQISSAHRSKIDLTARLDVGADGYLIEPIEPLELLATVKTLMRLADCEKDNHILIQQLSRSERLLAAAKLAQYRAIIAAATDGIALLDRKFRYLEQNPAHRVMLGYSDGELVGHTPAVHVEEEMFQQIATKLIETGRYAGEVRSRRKDGQWIDITLSALGVYDDNGEVLCYVSLGQDITKQKRAQETWRLHDRAINASDAGVLIVDALSTDQPIIFASVGFERLTGYQSAEVLGRNCRFLQGPETDRTQIARIRAALQAGEPIRVLLRNYRKDGTAFWNDLSISPVHDTAGCLTHFVGIMNDVTDMVDMQTSLRKSEEFNRTVLENSPDCVKILDGEGRLQFMNRNGLCLLQMDDFGPIRNRLWWDLWPEETQSTVRKSFETAMSGESARFQAVCPTAKGDPRWWDVIVVGVPIQSQPPERIPDRIIAVSRDVTEHKRHEKALRQWKEELEVRVQERTQELEATQERLVALSSQLSVTEQQERRKLARDLHDYLAQILAMGQMKTKLALKPSVLPAATRSVIEDMDKIFQQALTYTRTLIAELSPPQLHESGLPQALRWLGERFHKDQLWVEVRTNCEQVPLSEAQSVIVFQAVRELLFNVLKHAEVDRATVDLRLNEEGLLQITVSDQGRGLSADAMQRSSEPGHLGLFSVRERIEAMGGWVDMESSPGQGTTVTLMLRIGDTTPSTEPHVPSPDPSRRYADGLTQDHTPIRVLLVDDHKLVRQGLRDILAADERIRVVGEAGTCEEALMLVANLAPDVVITDINLPAMSGIEATKRFKKLYPQMLVIGLSCHAEEHIKQDMLSAGAEVLLSKERAADELAANIVTIYAKTSGM